MLFMTYHHGQYLKKVVAAGKEEHSIPLYRMFGRIMLALMVTTISPSSSVVVIQATIRREPAPAQSSTFGKSLHPHCTLSCLMST